MLYVLTKEEGGAGEDTTEEDMVGARDGLSASGEGPTEVVRSLPLPRYISREVLPKLGGFMEVRLCLGMSPRGLTEVRGFHGSSTLPRYVSAGSYRS